MRMIATFLTCCKIARLPVDRQNRLLLITPCACVQGNNWVVAVDKAMTCNILVPIPRFIITPYGRAVIFYYCINNIITLLLLPDIQFSRFYDWTSIQLQHFSIQAIYKSGINLQNHQYSNHTPKFSINKRVWLTKLLKNLFHYYSRQQCMTSWWDWLLFCLRHSTRMFSMQAFGSTFMS